MDKQTPGLELRYFLNVLLNGKWIIAATVVLSATIAIISNYFQTLRYQAFAQIQIDAPPFLPNPGTDLVAQSNYYLNIDRYFKTEKEKLNSHRMHLLFAQDLRRKNERFQSVAPEAIAAQLAGLKVEPVEDTNLLTLTLVSDNAKSAAEWLNLYVDFFIQENARTQEESVRQNREILSKQLDEIKKLLDAKQGQETPVAEGTPGKPPTGANDSEFIFGYQQAYEEARKKLNEERNKLSRLEPYLAAGTNLSGLPAFDFLPGLKSYYDRFMEANTQLEKLQREGKGELHPAVVAKRGEVQNLEGQLRSELKKSADALRVSVAMLQSSEANARSVYEQKLSERRSNSLQAQETERLNKVRDAWTSASTLVEEKLRSLKVMESFVSNNITVIERAEVNPYPVSRRGKVFVALAGFAGFLLGASLVLAGDFLNPKIKTVEEINSDLNVNALGFLPKASDFSIDQVRESYNSLRTELLFRRDTKKHRCIMVTSSVPQEGKTTVAMNLAKTLAAAGDRTVVVDFDLRKARLRALMSRGSQNGDTAFKPVEDLNMRLESTDSGTLDILVPISLPKHPPFVLSQPGVKDLIAQLKSRYDWVIIDTPPIASVTDAVIVASIADSILFVIKHDFVDKKIAKNSVAALMKVNSDIVGGILNDLDVRKISYLSYQGYYRYGVDSDGE